MHIHTHTHSVCVKIFEMELKESIIEHIVENQVINRGQHGFVPGRSTQTQLLEHYEDIFEAIMKGCRTDTVYLEYLMEYFR